MSNEIKIDGGITLVLSDDAMNAIFGSLLVSQVNNLQKQVDTLAMAITTLTSSVDDNTTAIEILQTDVDNAEESIGNIEAKIDDMPDFDAMPDLDEMATHGESIDTLESKFDKLDGDVDVINGILAAMGHAIFSKVQV